MKAADKRQISVELKKLNASNQVTRKYKYICITQVTNEWITIDCLSDNEM